MSTQTLIIDRVIPDVGRIKRASGITRKVVRDQINRTLDALRHDGRLDILRAIRDGELTLMQVYNAHRRHAVADLAIGVTSLPLASAFSEWAARHGCGEQHRASLETSRRYMAAHMPNAAVADLPRILEELRTSLGVKHPRSFNLARAAALAFVRATCKRSHPLWLKVASVETARVERKRRVRPLTVKEMRDLFPAPAADPVDAIAWSMAATGMGPKEYWGAWSVAADHVHIDGTKREGRVRDVPLLLIPSVPRLHSRTFADRLRDRTRMLTVYDLRRTYANWLESPGIPRTRRRSYLGHGARDVTDLYERHEVTAYLAEDAARLRSLLDVVAPRLMSLSRAVAG